MSKSVAVRLSFALLSAQPRPNRQSCQSSFLPSLFSSLSETSLCFYLSIYLSAAFKIIEPIVNQQITYVLTGLTWNIQLFFCIVPDRLFCQSLIFFNCAVVLCNSIHCESHCSRILLHVYITSFDSAWTEKLSSQGEIRWKSWCFSKLSHIDVHLSWFLMDDVLRAIIKLINELESRQRFTTIIFLSSLMAREFH